MVRRSGAALLVRAVLAAFGVLTAATAVQSLIADGAIASTTQGQVTGTAIVRSAATAANPEDRRGPAADPRRHEISQPTGAGPDVPKAANVRPRRPTVASPARSVTTSVAARSTPAAGSSTGSGLRAPAAIAYRGRNHLWIPSLGINRSVQWFPCSRSRPPDAGVYRWGCAGRNNVYLMSHAWSTFKPLHDAYAAGRLRKGMKVWYGDGAGRVHQFSVIWWRLTAPTTAASWAWAVQSRTSMTLQTCVGARNQYRLMVRLIQIS